MMQVHIKSSVLFVPALANFLDQKDFPDGWKGLDLTVEVEAKAKKLAVLGLKEALIESSG
ncbi:hypothetical protein [uncultured Desulfosarcina sp.]|uniref:hypothetical protein n=1 Tax=uncultured Desulfosarcina sp. TaxID=218289 RepID=UPI0029C62BBA|nr:hypothetical protein [uncultured Desulfosarcina sp.]